MKLLKLTTLTGAMLISTQVFSGVIENSQIMPPPGPYQSIMNNTPPAFVPYGSKQAQANPYNQRQTIQPYNHFPADTRAITRPANQLPEWVINQQQATKESIQKMLEENTQRLKDNEKRHNDFLKKSQELSAQRAKDNQKWTEENNKRLKQTWNRMLDQYSKNQKQQILQAENMPEWMKERMLKQHEQQLAMMTSNPPMPMNNMQQQNFNSNARQNFNPARNAMGRFNQPAPMVKQNFNHPQQQPNMRHMQQFPQAQMRPPVNRGQMQRPPMQLPPQQRQPYPVAPYNNYRR